ncbi:DUF6600 domain-containing protein [Janthinobacterium psychrotolerans]|uniref:FecR protein n=1 Tax=Janthinobacterium psychrotolerans TaxID=1747903 RepID=A0A1A7C882_9BURK|nr:DUF6600 domain-containing protein [Janthinobacterium psychrotolerans]OBV41234.1 hypothetical protein ASR47_102644 [Janthinobacterium psychrotolerans]
MRPTFLHAVFAFVLSAAGAPALAEPPERVGRISTVEGQVLVRAGDGEPQDALSNWPVSTDSRITTRRNALAEFRVGGAAVRLDGDSELDVTQLDDDHFKLHLAYGSVSLRVRNADALRGLELATAQARVVLTQPGWVRVDAERLPGTSVVSVLEGAADVDGGTASVMLRAGKRAELTDEALRTGPLQRIAFDSWPETVVAASPSLRYVTEDVTGYEELDRHGAWQDDAEYGPLWLPRAVPAGWAPYSDGLWRWIAPWGWTWIDNAPWGYAPSHYGRWVQVGQRWGWAPGRERVRSAWAPALVGWAGSDHGPRPGLQYRPGTGPGMGWFPLSPRERHVPGDRNRDRPRRDGGTSMPPPQVRNAPLGTAPSPSPAPGAGWQRPPREVSRPDFPRRDWSQRGGRLQTEDNAMPAREPRRPPSPAMPATPAAPAMPAAPVLPPVQDALVQPGRPSWRGDRFERPDRSERGDGFDRGNRPAPPPAMPAPRPSAEPRPERGGDRGGQARERPSQGRGNGRLQEAER